MLFEKFSKSNTVSLPILSQTWITSYPIVDVILGFAMSSQPDGALLYVQLHQIKHTMALDVTLYIVCDDFFANVNNLKKSNVFKLYVNDQYHQH